MELPTITRIPPIHKWLRDEEVKTENGEILDFYKYPFLFDIYADSSPLICCMKAAQIGFTTYEIIKTAYQCALEAIDIIYVLPTGDDVKKFSGGKTNKMIAHNPSLLSWTKDKDSIEQKQFNKNTIYYQGSWTERAALMITAKKLVVDEYDRCKQDIVEQYDSRLQSVANPQKAFFSNPSKPDFGIDKFYQKSDQKKWHITHSCGETYVMDENCIDYFKGMYICPKCKGEITTEQRRMGKWIATSKGEWSGYLIPLWIAPWMPAKKICEAKREKSAEYFANFVAGEPYLNTNDALSQPLLEQCLDSNVNEQLGGIVIGVDTGHNIYYTMANEQGFFYHGYANSVQENAKALNPIPNYDPYNELRGLMKRYPKAMMIADQGGDLIGIRKLQEEFKGRVFLCWFTKETKNIQIIRWGENEERGRVLVDRNRAIQMFVDEIKDKRATFNGSKEEWQPVFTHALNTYRVREETGDIGDPQYNWRWVWKRKSDDHLFMCCIYTRIGLDRFGQGQAQILPRNDNFTKGVLNESKMGYATRQNSFRESSGGGVEYI